MRRLFAASCLILLTAGPGSGQQALPPRKLTAAEADRLLKAPVRIDAKSAAVLARSRRTYAGLKTLLTSSEGAGMKTEARLKRPRFYHYLQTKPSGELLGVSIGDGKSYYEYAEASRKYVQRSIDVLPTLALPANVRPFYADVARGQIMKGLRGEASVREYAFAYVGEGRDGGAKLDRIRVSTMVNLRGAWQSYDSIRDYTRDKGLVRRVSSGRRVISFKNQVGVSLPSNGFVWKAIPDATRAFE